MQIIIFMIMTTGNVEYQYVKLEEYEFCSDKMMEYVTTNKVGNGILFKNQRIQLHWCTTLDGKYYVSYYDPEFEANK